MNYNNTCLEDVTKLFWKKKSIRGFSKFYDHFLPTAVVQKVLLLSCSSKIIITNGNCCDEEMITLDDDIVKNIRKRKPEWN